MSTTQIRSRAGSAHAIVPVEPVCPKVDVAQLAHTDSIPTSKPSPRDSMPAELWFRIIRLPTSGLNSLPVGCKNSSRNLPTSAADAWTPPHGALAVAKMGCSSPNSLNPPSHHQIPLPQTQPDIASSAQVGAVPFPSPNAAFPKVAAQTAQQTL